MQQKSDKVESQQAVVVNVDDEEDMPGEEIFTARSKDKATPIEQTASKTMATTIVPVDPSQAENTVQINKANQDDFDAIQDKDKKEVLPQKMDYLEVQSKRSNPSKKLQSELVKKNISRMKQYDDTLKPRLNLEDGEFNYEHRCAFEYEPNFVKKQVEGKAAMKKLLCTAIVCFCFMTLEVVGGYYSNSLAIMVDAAHTLSDVAGFLINFASVYISQRKINSIYNMGYHRSEILGAMLSIIIIWGLLIWLNIEAIHRVSNPPDDLDATVMIITSGVGLMCNIINICQLNAAEFSGEEEPEQSESDGSLISSIRSKRSGRSIRSYSSRRSVASSALRAVYQPRQLKRASGQRARESDIESIKLAERAKADQRDSVVAPIMGENGDNQKEGGAKEKTKEEKAAEQKNKTHMNVRAAILHIMGDMLQSIGVIIASAILMAKPEWKVVDPAATFLFSILVMFTTCPIAKECYLIIMETTPTDIETMELYNEICALKSVQEIHDFHCWTVAGGKYMMTCHVRSRYGEKCVRDINKLAKQPQYGIYHSTIQVEKESTEATISCEYNS